MTLLDEIKAKCSAELLASQDADAIAEVVNNTVRPTPVTVQNDETTDRVTLTGDTLNIPAIVVSIAQPA